VLLTYAVSIITDAVITEQDMAIRKSAAVVIIEQDMAVEEFVDADN
jgi:hypothetical protein